MPRYDVYVTQTIKGGFEVEAGNKDEARKKAVAFMKTVGTGYMFEHEYSINDVESMEDSQELASTLPLSQCLS